MQVGNELISTEAQSVILKMACHLLVDLTPATGLEELLEKAAEIRDYYCSLANWTGPAISQTGSIKASPIVKSFERDSFAYAEE
jgi:hypothetical protein